MPLEGCWRGATIPVEPGVYRIRRSGAAEVDYIGQTGVTLRVHLSQLTGIYKLETLVDARADLSGDRRPQGTLDVREGVSPVVELRKLEQLEVGKLRELPEGGRRRSIRQQLPHAAPIVDDEQQLERIRPERDGMGRRNAGW